MKKTLCAFIGSLMLSGCSLLDIDPDNVVPSESAFDDVKYYQQALNYVYRSLADANSNMQMTDFASDDFGKAYEGYSPSNYYVFKWDYSSQPEPHIWASQYSLISKMNVLSDNYSIVPVPTEEERVQRDQIYAQAIALRAWSFFNLVQLYAPRYDGTNGQELGIPLKLKLDREYLPQSPLETVYGQIISDLEKAESIFVETSFTPLAADEEFVFGLDAVRALKARVALFMGDLEMAKESAKSFIDRSFLSKEEYEKLWKDIESSENQEVIFMTYDLSDTDEAQYLDYQEMYEFNSVSLATDLLLLFEDSDIRKYPEYINDINMPSKYRIDYQTTLDQNLNYKHFRLAEQYLIYAEAVLDTNPSEALKVVNTLREARGASLYATIDLKKIMNERRLELFSEGLRFYDLKRISERLNITVERSSGELLVPGSKLYNWDIPLVETNSNPYID
ncbi:RagB/SusD family nutrient uptake outer membrane protein [Sediminitomix flava]|uniref:SusD-like starch-binding protein associating with outer membrane n=1 Tax=Sediminitomix flava TaxID=379075 RepID=A0A315Z973_SEDFL|nr:RagB/SusD family nutrient uptake outer membrane protein [Sediminitomix flava]PWJ41940.1 SusD-like starch-binding protein associating with outer membrane [Sediminitomix flava]